ncbi:MAG TPA: glycosyltransferase family 39 protein [Terriglobales bacterium]|nr:glycosyltransferase family 39 protein [Terriglobales bacterium]
MTPSDSPLKRHHIAGVIFLLIILALELGLFIHRETQTWDEGCHIFAGYSYWSRGDFGMNPEHPPLVKLLTTLPLLSMPLDAPPHDKVFNKEQDFTISARFVFDNNAEEILRRTRMVAALITLLTAILLFLAAREMFGVTAAFVALALFVFEPNMLAHGAVITTDMAMSCFLLATVYAFYRYAKKPTAVRLVLAGLAAGLAMATKHSSILLPPMLILLAAGELIRRSSVESSVPHETRRRQAVRLAVALIAIGAIAGMVLWSTYGFHLQPRPGVDATQRIMDSAARLKHPFQAKMIVTFARWHLLPQSYLYGLTDVGFTAEFSHSYLLGTIHPHGVWYYFPVAFAIKTTLGLMILLALVPVAVLWSRVRRGRELMFVLIPAGIYLAVAMLSLMNIGIRHLLPVYPLLMLLAGWAAATLIEHRRAWVYVVALLLAWNAVSSLRAAPVYISYSNELWGGPPQTYRYLSDSNADWGQQLHSVRQYLDARGVKNCWFAYFADVVVEPSYYGVPCKPLTTIASVWLRPEREVPAAIDGPVLISAGVLSGYEFGPGELNPYEQFRHIHPTAVIENAVFVFDGHFEIPLAAARNHVTRSQLATEAGRLDEAQQEAETAVQLAPRSVEAQANLGFLLMRMNRLEEGRAALEKALASAETVQPEFQAGWAKGLRGALQH